MLLERETSVSEILDWLQAEANARNIPLKIFQEQVEERKGVYFVVGVPVRIEGDDEAYDEAKLLTKLENAWNDREPRPEKLLFLLPAGLPQGVW